MFRGIAKTGYGDVGMYYLCNTGTGIDQGVLRIRSGGPSVRCHVFSTREYYFFAHWIHMDSTVVITTRAKEIVDR